MDGSPYGGDTRRLGRNHLAVDALANGKPLVTSHADSLLCQLEHLQLKVCKHGPAGGDHMIEGHLKAGRGGAKSSSSTFEKMASR
jgi:hypothetical protein